MEQMDGTKSPRDGTKRVRLNDLGIDPSLLDTSIWREDKQTAARANGFSFLRHIVPLFILLRYYTAYRHCMYLYFLGERFARLRKKYRLRASERTHAEKSCHPCFHFAEWFPVTAAAQCV